MQDGLIKTVVINSRDYGYVQGRCSRCEASTDELVRVGRDRVQGFPEGHRSAPRFCRACFKLILEESYAREKKSHTDWLENFRTKRPRPLLSREGFDAHILKRVVSFRCGCGVYVGYLREAMGVEPTECQKCSARTVVKRHKVKHGKGIRQAVCLECGGDFEAKRSTATFCSPKCRQASLRSGNPAAIAIRQERDKAVEVKKAKKAERDAYWNDHRYVKVEADWLTDIRSRLHEEFKIDQPLKIRDGRLMDDSIMHYGDGPFVILKVGELIKTPARSQPEWLEACYEVAQKRYADRKAFYDECQDAIKDCEQRDADRQEYTRKSYQQKMEDLIKGLRGGSSHRAEDLSILGLSGQPDIATIKSAYRSKSKLHHPDKGGDQVEFLKIKSAYDRLKSGFTDHAP